MVGNAVLQFRYNPVRKEEKVMGSLFVSARMLGRSFFSVKVLV